MPHVVPDIVAIRAASEARAEWFLSCAPLSLMKLWTCVVNQTEGIDRGARTINVDGGALHNSFAFADILPGQPVVVETANGTERVRLKSVAGDEFGAAITVAQNNIAWADGQAITVYCDYPLWPVRSRVSPAGVFLKDYDVPHTDQNVDPPPIAVQGPDWAGELELVGSVVAASATLDATESQPVAQGATITAWLWEAQPAAGASIADSAAETTTVTYTTSGPRWIKLTVTDSNGKTAYCRAMHHAHDEDYPAMVMERAPFTCDRDQPESGTCQFVVRAAADAAQDALPDLGRIMIWSKPYLDGVLSYQGGWTGRQMNEWQGYIVSDSVRRRPGSTLAELEAENVVALLNRMRNYSVALAYKATPTRWVEYANGGITIAQGLAFLWGYHSTLLQVAPVILPTDSVLRRYACDDVWQKASLLAQGRSFALDRGIFAYVCVTNQGVVHVETDAQIYPADYLSADFTLTDRDWAGEMVIERQPVRQVDLVQLSGFSFNGVTPTALIGKAPGDVADDFGDGDFDLEGLVLENQADVNVLSGRVFAKENNPFPSATVQLSPAVALGQSFLIAPQKWYTVVLDASDAYRFDWSAGWPLVPRRIETLFEAGKVTRTVTFEPFAQGADGVTGDYPTDPPDDDPDDDPEDPDVPWPPTPPPETDPPKAAVTFDEGSGTELMFDAANWEARNSDALILAKWGMVQRGWQSLQGSSELAKTILVKCGLGWIKLSKDCGLTWTDITPTTLPPNMMADAVAPQPTTVTYTMLECPNAVTRTIHVIAEWQNLLLQWRGWYLRTDDFGVTWDWISLDVLAGGGAALWNEGYFYAVNTLWTPSVGAKAGLYHWHGGTKWCSFRSIPADGGDNAEGLEDGSMTILTGSHVQDGYENPDGLNVHAMALLIDFGCIIDPEDVFTHKWLEVLSKVVVGGNLMSPQLWVSPYGSAFDDAANIGEGDLTALPHSVGDPPVGGWQSGISCEWTKQSEGGWTLQWKPSEEIDVPFRYAMLIGTVQPTGFLGVGAASGEYDCHTEIDAVRVGCVQEGWDETAVDCVPVSYNHRPLGLAVDFDTGENIYITAWRYNGTNGSLVLLKIDWTAKTSTIVETFATPVTQAQMEAGTHLIWPRVVYQPTVAGWGDKVYVFGSTDGFAYLGESLDAGLTFTDRSGTLTAKAMVRALAAVGDGSGLMANFYAFTSDGFVFKETAWAWDVGNALPFAPGPGGITVGYDAALTIMMARLAAGALKIETAPEPYTVWTNKTDAHGVGGITHVVQWLTP